MSISWTRCVFLTIIHFLPDGLSQLNCLSACHGKLCRGCHAAFIRLKCKKCHWSSWPTLPQSNQPRLVTMAARNIQGRWLALRWYGAIITFVFCCQFLFPLELLIDITSFIGCTLYTKRISSVAFTTWPHAAVGVPPYLRGFAAFVFTSIEILGESQRKEFECCACVQIVWQPVQLLSNYSHD